MEPALQAALSFPKRRPLLFGLGFSCALASPRERQYFKRMSATYNGLTEELLLWAASVTPPSCPTSHIGPWLLYTKE